MNNFTYYNPTRLVFGRGTIAQVSQLIGCNKRILMTYGRGSIKKNGVYGQVTNALQDHSVIEFGGIEANPRYETCLKAAELCRKENIDFLLAVGGGSVLDATKFIAAVALYDGADPWDIPTRRVQVEKALPLGSVLTLPATGSESNAFAVITRDSICEKRGYPSDVTRPRFSILDPETTFSLPRRQTVNGIVDAFAHVMEQYMTHSMNTPLQHRQAEAILLTLIEEGPKVLANPKDYDARANIMWCANQAFNGLIGCGVVGDWATHIIGHELTALWGVDHGQSLAVLMPGVWRHQKERKKGMLLQYAERVWGITDGSEHDRIEQAIRKTVDFFHRLGMKTAPDDYGIPRDGYAEVADRLEKRGVKLGEHKDIGPKEVIEILELCSD